MKYLPTILAVLGMLTTAFAPALQHLIAIHPEAGAFVGGLAVILAHLAPPPQK